ncbi:stage 0 sporulation family protein [candidate division KSB1 bacterium]
MMPNFVEVLFKANRRCVYSNPEEYPLRKNDFVILRADKGIDIGLVNNFFEEFKPPSENYVVHEILRKASQDEIAKLSDNRKKEDEAKPVAKRLFKKHELDMRLTDIEYQLDANKITFYFTADERVDFRELVKDLAQQFKARIELRQISLRESARKLGGCGKCGLELCCTTCIVHVFQPISTQCAKEQMMSTNPSKLTGMCGRLRCCLRYELPMYQEEIQKYPVLDSEINYSDGKAKIEKIDIFKQLVYLRREDDIVETIPLEEVNKIMSKN